MKFTHPQISIMTREFNDDPCLYFSFKGKFTKIASELSSDAWTQGVSQSKIQKFVFVWDCTEMTGFEILARSRWHSKVDDFKYRISYVIVISNNIIIRSAARVMLGVIGVSCVILRKKDALEGLGQETY